MKHLRLLISLACCLVGPALPAATLYWDADATAAGNDPASGAGLGGTGNWDQMSSLWFNGVNDVAWVNANNDDAVLAGTVGTVTLTENIAARNLSFTNTTGSFVITNATGVETLTLSGAVDTGGGEHALAVPLVNAAGLVKTGDGRLHLLGTNSGTLGGSIAVNGGVISVEANTALGAAAVTVANGAAVELQKSPNNAFTLDGTGIANSGALRNTLNNNTLYGPVTLASSGARINADLGNLTTRGGISGAGNPTLVVGGTNAAQQVQLNTNGVVPYALNIGSGILYKDGPSVVSVQTPNVYAKTVVSRGTYLFGIDETRLGTIPSVFAPDDITLSNNATLSVSGGITLSANRGITLGSGGGTIAKGSGTLTVAGQITGEGGLTMAGGASGFMYLCPSNSFQGDFNMTGGIVYFSTNANGAAGPAGVTTAAGLGNVVLTPSGANAQLRGYPGGIVTNNLVLNSSTYVAMTLTVGNGLNAPFTFAGNISGNGPLQRINAGTSWATTTVFSGDNRNWSGGLTIASTVIGLGHRYALGTGPLVIGPVTSGGVGLMATVPLIGTNAVPTPVTISNAAWAVQGANPLELSGPMTLTVSPTINTYPGTSLILSGNIGNVSDATSMSLTKTGTGTLILKGNNNTYDGGTEAMNGTLVLDCSATPGPIMIDWQGTLALGPDVTTVTINGDLYLGGNLAVNVDKSLSPATDLAVVTGTLQNTGEGVVRVTNLGPALAPGDTLKLFNKSLAGGSGMQVSGGGVLWTNNLEVDGTIGVQSVLPTPSFSGGSYDSGNLAFSFSVTNGYPGSTYYVLSSTNVALPTASWTRELTNTFDSTGAFSLSLPASASVPEKFYLLQVVY